MVSDFTSVDAVVSDLTSDKYGYAVLKQELFRNGTDGQGRNVRCPMSLNGGIRLYIQGSTLNRELVYTPYHGGVVALGLQLPGLKVVCQCPFCSFCHIATRPAPRGYR